MHFAFVSLGDWFIAGAGSGGIVFDKMECSGNEDRLIDCSHEMGSFSCLNLEVGVKCTGM